jgi:hypothetical protein
VRARLAPLSESQRSSLTLLWYRILERHELGAAATAVAAERQAKGRADSFMRVLTASPGITRLAQTPLFLLALLKLHRLGRDLPRNRFDASKEIIEQLIEHQPRRRAKDAMQLRPAQKMRQRERLLEDFAFGLHSGELRGAVADGVFESDAVARAARLILARTGRTDNTDAAQEEARAVFSFGEEVAGVLSTLPSAGVGALLMLILFQYDLSMIGLIGIILLIGIVKKNAIMMIDFALDAERNHGLSPLDSIHRACLLRFRPIMMTTMAALLGGLPLMLSFGAGSELRRPLGFTIVGGLLLSQWLTLYTTPVVYLYFAQLTARRQHVRASKAQRLLGAMSLQDAV